ncbi:MAG: hypothetical protein DDG59_03530 [Anaerolineae bacterium]|jgi:LmbE family N-acetylglucosaminyl deacetylase|nr:MAG: hypothetical protein DDG59_03530 [Anaerolineae bacterium]
MPTALVISPHADDAAAFCGATLAKRAAQGWKIVLVRVTDDSKDSVGLSEEETRRRITAELHQAASILGIDEIVELGYETDRLFAVSELELRERFVYLIRKYRPYAVFSFDPDGWEENNQDHKRVAEAMDEALWVAAFDKHYPEHFKEGYQPYCVVERWFFGRKLPNPNRAEDISEFLEKKIDALCAHQTQMKHLLHQYQMQLAAWGRRVPWVDVSYEGDHKEIVAVFLQEQANAVAREFGLGEGRMGELFRYVRFGDLEELFQMMSEPLQSAESLPEAQPQPQPTLSAAEQEDYLRHILASNLHQRLRLMGHHHLCAGAFEELFQSIPFRLSYQNLVAHLKASPDLEVESIFGYDIFCYQCGYWDNEQGRCSTGWKNKISKDAAVLDYLGIRTGEVRRLEDLQRLLAEKITPEVLYHFCGPGEWKCENYVLGICQRGYAKLRQRFGFE